jgi:hypothetical protein
MTEQETKDLAELHVKMQEIKNQCYDYLRSLDRADRAELDISGYRGKSNAEAMQMAYKSYALRIEKLQKEYFRKYPD